MTNVTWHLFDSELVKSKVRFMGQAKTVVCEVARQMFIVLTGCFQAYMGIEMLQTYNNAQERPHRIITYLAHLH